MKILTDSGQPLDPNLVKLRDAFDTVVAKLGPEKAAALMRGDDASNDSPGDGGDAGVAPEGGSAAPGLDYPEDLREGVQVLLQGKKTKKKSKSHTPGCVLRAVCHVTHAAGDARFGGVAASWATKRGHEGMNVMLEAALQMECGRRRMAVWLRVWARGGWAGTKGGLGVRVFVLVLEVGGSRGRRSLLQLYVPVHRRTVT